MKIKGMVAASAVLAAALALAGCSGSGGGSDSGGAVTLKVVGWKGKGTNVGDMPKLNAAFEKANPNIKLDYTYVDRANYDQYMNPRLAGGNAADVIMVDTTLTKSWGSQGYLADLSKESWVKRQLPALRNAAKVGGKTRAVISEVVPTGLFVNTDLLKSAGIDSVPTTWPEFTSDLQTLKSAGKGGLIVGQKTAFGGTILSYMMAANSVPTNWATEYEAKKTTFSKKWSPVVDDLKYLFDKKYVDPAQSLGLDELVDVIPQFTAGNYAFLAGGGWSLGQLKKDSSFDVQFAPFPGGSKGSDPKTFAFVGTGWSVNDSTKHSAAARTYIDFMSKPKNAETYLKAEAAATTFTDVESPALSGAEAISKAAGSGRVEPWLIGELNQTDAATVYGDTITQLFLKPDTPTKDILSTLDAKISPTHL